jgi:hypothetical protein
MTDPIQIAAPISKACKSSAFAAVEPRQSPKIVEGQGAQSVVFGVVEQPGQFFGRSLDSVEIE